MIDYNFFNVEIINLSNLFNNYTISIYCNNFNYNGILTNESNILILNPVIVPLYYNNIYVQFKNIYNDRIAIFYIPNKIGVYKIKINYDIFYIKIQNVINISYKLLKLPETLENKLDNNYTYILL